MLPAAFFVADVNTLHCLGRIHHTIDWMMRDDFHIHNVCMIYNNRVQSCSHVVLFAVADTDNIVHERLHHMIRVELLLFLWSSELPRGCN